MYYFSWFCGLAGQFLCYSWPDFLMELHSSAGSAGAEESRWSHQHVWDFSRDSWKTETSFFTWSLNSIWTQAFFHGGWTLREHRWKLQGFLRSKLWNFTVLLLSHSKGQSKSPGQLRFKGVEKETQVFTEEGAMSHHKRNIGSGRSDSLGDIFIMIYHMLH